MVHHSPCTLHSKLLEGELGIQGFGFNTWALMGWRAGPRPAHQSPSVKPQTLDPQLSLQQLQVQGAGRMVNHHTRFRVANLFDLGWLADEGYKKNNPYLEAYQYLGLGLLPVFKSISVFRFRVAIGI